MALETRRFFNPSQPQTLQISVWLLYFNVFWSLIALLTGSVFGLLTLVGFAGSAYGIANEKRWAYVLGVVVAILDLVLVVIAAGGISEVFTFSSIVSLMFAVALVVALLHPTSRSYQRIWFR